MIKQYKTVFFLLFPLLTACNSNKDEPTPTITLLNQEKIVFTDSLIHKELSHEPFTNSFSGGSGEGALQFSSNNESVAIINEQSGLVEIIGEGSVTITVTKGADTVFDAASASFQVIVRDVIGEHVQANINAQNVKLSFTNYSPDLEIYRTTEEGCLIENYATCENSELSTIQDVGETTHTDSFVNLNRKGFVFFKSNELVSQPLEISPPSFEKRGENGLISFKNKLFMIAGLNWSYGDDGDHIYYNDVWAYENNKWSKLLDHAPFSPRSHFSTVIFKDHLWLIGGTIELGSGATTGSKEIWRSPDGVNWQLVKDNMSYGSWRTPQAVVFKDKIWIFDHVAGKIHSSEDGENWNVESNTTPFDNRNSESLIVFQEKLWLIAGTIQSKNGEWVNKSQNDIWSSENGIDWVLESEHAEFPIRSSQQVVEFENKLFLYGGWIQNSEKVYNDVWQSEDGIHWIQKATDTFPIDGYISDSRKITEHDNKLWSHGALNDPIVWASKDGIEWRAPSSLKVKW